GGPQRRVPAGDGAPHRERRDQRTARRGARARRAPAAQRPRHAARGLRGAVRARDDPRHGRPGARDRDRDPAAHLPTQFINRKIMSLTHMPSITNGVRADRKRPLNAGKQTAFTLIEVLVVVAILAILAAIVVPQIMDRPDEAKRVAARADIRAIAQALKLYRLDN